MFQLNGNNLPPRNYLQSRLYTSQARRRFLQSADVTQFRKMVNLEYNLSKVIVDKFENQSTTQCHCIRGKCHLGTYKKVWYKLQEIIIFF